MDKPKTGGPGAPTLRKKEVAEFSVTPDVQRIMGMKANPEGFDPEINQPISDLGAKSYAARIQERMAAKKSAAVLKGKPVPLGHVEPPPREKMEAIAALSGGGMPRPNFMEPPPAEPEQPAPKSQLSPQAPPMKGVGAAYPVNQAMAQGKVDRPVSLREANKMAQQGGFSKETVQALEMANENLKKAEAEPAPVAEPEPEKSSSPSVAKKVREELDEAEQSLPTPAGQLDFAEIGNLRTGMMSTKRREDIEKRLKPLDIGDMVMKRELTQTVPIIPGRLEVTLRTFSQRENLWILRYIYDHPGSALYIQELINTCRLVCGLVAVNGAYLPDHRKDVGLPTETIIKEDFEKKFFHVVSFPVQLVADFSVQSLWFQDRVDKLFTVDALKNG
jgi:hypothetical protein